MANLMTVTIFFSFLKLRAQVCLKISEFHQLFLLIYLFAFYGCCDICICNFKEIIFSQITGWNSWSFAFLDICWKENHKLVTYSKTFRHQTTKILSILRKIIKNWSWRRYYPGIILIKKMHFDDAYYRNISILIPGFERWDCFKGSGWWGW